MTTLPTPIVPIQTQDPELAEVLGRIERLGKLWNDPVRLNQRQFAQETARFLEEDQTQEPWIWRNPAETEEHWLHKVKHAFNLAEFIVDTVATTFVTPPVREVIASLLQLDDEEDALFEARKLEQSGQLKLVNAWLQKHIWGWGEYGQDSTFQDVEKWTWWHGTVCVEPRYSKIEAVRPNEEDRDGVEPLYYRRHEFEVLETESDPRKAEAAVLVVRFPQDVTRGRRDSGDRMNQAVMHYWDDEVVVRLVDWVIDPTGMQIEGLEGELRGGVLFHGLGRMPLTFARHRKVQKKFFSPGVDCQLFPESKSINKHWTEFGHILQVSHGYPWVRGKLSNATLAPDGIIEVGETGQFGVEQPGQTLGQVKDGIERLQDNLPLTMHMAPGSIRIKPSQAASGVAIQSERAQTELIRLKHVPSWLKFEKDYLRRALDVFRLGTGKAADEMPLQVQSDLNVSFQPPPVTLTKKDTTDYLSWKRTNGLISRRRMLMEAEPELEPAEVDRILREVDAEVAFSQTTTSSLASQFAVESARQTGAGASPLTSAFVQEGARQRAERPGTATGGSDDQAQEEEEG